MDRKPKKKEDERKFWKKEVTHPPGTKVWLSVTPPEKGRGKTAR
jgi:hypothetical protein